MVFFSLFQLRQRLVTLSFHVCTKQSLSCFDSHGHILHLFFFLLLLFFVVVFLHKTVIVVASPFMCISLRLFSRWKPHLSTVLCVAGVAELFHVVYSLTHLSFLTCSFSTMSLSYQVLARVDCCFLFCGYRSLPLLFSFFFFPAANRKLDFFLLKGLVLT